MMHSGHFIFVMICVAVYSRGSFCQPGDEIDPIYISYQGKDNSEQYENYYNNNGGKDCEAVDEYTITKQVGVNIHLQKGTTTKKYEVDICQQNEIECPVVDGEYPVYFPLPDCTKFCQCSNGKPYLHDCPDGLHFNSILNICVWPHGDDNNCDDGKKETTTVETTTEVDLCQQNGIECPNVDGKDPVYIALPDCTKFCQCSNGIPYQHYCPNGLHFNSKLNICDWPVNANCSSISVWYL
nr:peritrophin-1-like [Leptinotarsa decemlineata]